MSFSWCLGGNIGCDVDVVNSKDVLSVGDEDGKLITCLMCRKEDS